MFLWLRNRSREADHEEERPQYIPLENVEEAGECSSDDSTLREVSLEEEKASSHPPHPLRRAAKRVIDHLQFLLPSFLQSVSGEPKKLHPTAWLDGLRGVAAFLVVFHHSSLLWFTADLHSAWVPGHPRWLIQLPIIRLIMSGAPHVAIFFVVSGYAISHKPLRLARQSRFAEVGSTLASSFFRRHTRLFMPAAAVTFASGALTQLGWFARTGLPGVAAPTREPPHAADLWTQMLHVAWTEVAVTDPVGQEHVQSGMPRRVVNPYDLNLWTLPIEFNSSMVVFMFLAAFSRVHDRVRMLFAFALMFYFQYIFVYWALFLFLGGMLICDLHFELEERRSRSCAEDPQPDETVSLPVWGRDRQGFTSRIIDRIINSGFPRKIPGLVFFVLALWLLSMPEMGRGAREAPGFATIAYLTPANFGDDLVVPLGAVLLVLVVDRATHLQVLFTNPFSQYLGRISFSLYMVHGPLLWTLGSVLGQRCVEFTGGNTPETYGLGIALASFLWWPVAIYFADLVHRCVDSKSVQFSRWAYERLLKKEA